MLAVSATADVGASSPQNDVLAGTICAYTPSRPGIAAYRVSLTAAGSDADASPTRCTFIAGGTAILENSDLRQGGGADSNAPNIQYQIAEAIVAPGQKLTLNFFGNAGDIEYHVLIEIADEDEIIGGLGHIMRLGAGTHLNALSGTLIGTLPGEGAWEVDVVFAASDRTDCYMSLLCDSDPVLDNASPVQATVSGAFPFPAHLTIATFLCHGGASLGANVIVPTSDSAWLWVFAQRVA